LVAGRATWTRIPHGNGPTAGGNWGCTPRPLNFTISGICLCARVKA
jgi:hypothetical protein